MLFYTTDYFLRHHNGLVFVMDMDCVLCELGTDVYMLAGITSVKVLSKYLFMHK